MSSPVPVKTSSLHNFTLPSLWPNRGPRHNASSPPPHRLSPSTENCPPPSPPHSPQPTDRKISLKIRGVTSTDKTPENPEAEAEAEAEADAEAEAVAVAEAEADDEDEETLAKVWKLKTRKMIKQKSGKNGNVSGEKKSTHKAGTSSGGNGKKKDKDKKDVKPKDVAKLVTKDTRSKDVKQMKETKEPVKFSVTLTRSEIEEDLFAMTGAKPSRRPKKRPKPVQKQLDDTFPGLFLGLINPDRYKVNEGSDKV